MYWEGLCFVVVLFIKWQIVVDFVDEGIVLNSNDFVFVGGLYGLVDIVMKKKYWDFCLYVEFLVFNEGGNSGVYF